MKKILVALQTFSKYSDIPLNLLKKSGAQIVLNNLSHRLIKDEIIELGGDCNGIIAGVEPYDKEVLDRLSKLQCISRCGVGIDNIDLKLAEEKNIKILNTPYVVIQPVAEMAFSMALDLSRLLTYHTIILKSGQWKKKAGHLIHGRKIGIIGLGRIGKKVAELFRLLNAELYATDLYPDELWAKKNNVKIVSIDEIFKECDIISIHVSINKEKTLFIGEKEILKMKKGCIIINTSRGQIIDENALYNGLKSEHLGGAGLDVFNNEPNIGRLKELDNVVLSPHISTLTEESRTEMEIQAVENILKYFNLPIIKE